MRTVVVALVALAGCAHAPARAPAKEVASKPLVAPVAPKPPAPESIESILAAGGLSYLTVEPGRRWLVGFADDDPARPEHARRTVEVEIVRGDVFTMVMGRLGTAPPDAGVAFFRNLARRNFDVAQLKLGLDDHDVVYASFELPSRIVDRQELLEDVFTLAKLMGDSKAALLDPTPERPPPPKHPKPKAQPMPSGIIIEARR